MLVHLATLLGAVALATASSVAASSLSPFAQEQKPTADVEDEEEKQQAEALAEQAVVREPEDNVEHRDETGRFVEVGEFEDSYLIPGTSVSFLFSGYTKLDFIQDLDPIGNPDQFQTSTIPVEGTPEAEFGGDTNLHAKESRVSFDFRSPTSLGPFRGYFEADFYGDGNILRLRHAYGVLGGLLGGQAWTTFMDISTQPDTMDFEGPDSQIFVRQAMVRWEQHVSDNLRWAVAVEDPNPQIENASGVDGEAGSTVPDIVGRVRYETERGRLHVAGIARQLRFDSGASKSVSAIGWGANVTGHANFFDRDTLYGQIAFGRGIARYVNAFGGFDSDAVVTAEGDVETIPGWNFFVAYTHYWTPTLRSGATFAMSRLDNRPAQSGDSIREVRSPHVNLVWSPWYLVNIGVEYMWGKRGNKDGAFGTANRVQFSVRFKFN